MAIDGDAYFPEPELGEWQVVWSEPHPATKDQPLSFTFETLERKSQELTLEEIATNPVSG
jgi:hypothetical protein